MYKVSAAFKRAYNRYQRQVGGETPETNPTRVMAAYDCVLVAVVR